MIRFFSKSPAVILATGLAAGAIVGGACVAVAEQVHMQNALRALENARSQLTEAVADKGGHRERAIGFVNSAIAETQAGIQYAR
ncbi:MAG: hypothetical protein JOY64_10690 [Alphaproteobacteria bacterium]|nr:hypothetical protein [Alphaproteobacteria bacterium]MBV8408087.1 hypothetical protein [Alphaproteobacteria bacterium]